MSIDVLCVLLIVAASGGAIWVLSVLISLFRSHRSPSHVDAFRCYLAGLAVFFVISAVAVAVLWFIVSRILF